MRSPPGLGAVRYRKRRIAASPPPGEATQSLEAGANAYHGNGYHFAATKSVQTRFLLTGLLQCAIRACRGSSVCQNSTLLPRKAIEREVLEVLLQAVLTRATLDGLLTVVNAWLRAQATASRPRLKELKGALARVEREIASFTRAVGGVEFASLEGALKAAEARREVLRREIEQAETTRRRTSCGVA